MIQRRLRTVQDRVNGLVSRFTKPYSEWWRSTQLASCTTLGLCLVDRVQYDTLVEGHTIDSPLSKSALVSTLYLCCALGPGLQTLLGVSARQFLHVSYGY